MPIIKPISDLRNKAKEISRLVHKENEPVFITKNGEGDMVVMSLAQYGQLQMRLELYQKKWGQTRFIHLCTCRV